jgi:hypothetical protein
MPGVEYDGDDAAPRSPSRWLVIGALVAVALLVFTRGVVTLLVLGLVAVLAGLVVGLGYATIKAVRGKVPESGDHNPPGFGAGGGPAKQRAEAGHVSPSASR